MWGPGKCFLCFTDTETQCDKCGLYYCDDHLSSHRLQCVAHVFTRELHVSYTCIITRYQDTCLPFAVETRPGVGRVVTATRDIKVCHGMDHMQNQNIANTVSTLYIIVL